jgi:hypothetical protein
MTLFAVFQLIVGLGTLAALGYGLLTLLAPDAPLWWFERAAFSFVLGMGGGAFAWVALIPVYPFLQPRWALVIVTMAVLTAAGLRDRRKVAPSTSRLMQPNWLVIACSIVMIGQFAMLMAASMHTRLGWDGLFNLEFKARLAFEHQPQGQLPLAYFSDVSRAWSHPSYPLLVPFSEFWLYSWLGRIDEHAIKVLSPLYFFAVIAGVCGAIRRVTNTETAIVSGVFACAVPAMVNLGTTGYAEIPLSAAITAALSCAALGLSSRQPAMFVLAGAFGAIAAWTKTEGLLLALYLGSAVLLSSRLCNRGRGTSVLSLKAMSAVLWIPVAASVPWFVMQYFYGITEPDFPSILPSVALAHLDRLPEIVTLVLRALLTPGQWGLLWPAFAAACVLAVWRRDADHLAVLSAGAVLVPLAAYTLIYLFSAWDNVGDHVRTSIDRLLTPLASAALIFTVSRAWLLFT